MGFEDLRKSRSVRLILIFLVLVLVLTIVAYTNEQQITGNLIKILK